MKKLFLLAVCALVAPLFAAAQEATTVIEKFGDKTIKGVIIAGAFDVQLSQADGSSRKVGAKVEILKDSVTALAHPSVSPDGRWLYFVSDAVGGQGGKDIFRARINGNDFGPMENLGPEINTPGDEVFPYVRDSVTLYFASNGHPGMGGLDLFRATLDSTEHWHVENMRSPINSNRRSK